MISLINITTGNILLNRKNMAIYVGIEKYKQIEYIYYYKVETNNFGGILS